MTGKQIIVNDIDVSGCEHLTEIEGCWVSTCDYLPYKGNITNELCKYNPNCYYKQLQREKQNSQEARDTAIKEFNRAEELKTLLKRKEESYEELRQYHNKCCEDNAKELAEWFKEYNQVSRDFHNGDFCNTEKCQQLAQLKEENDRLRKRIVTIFDCLIKANRDVIVDTLWVDKITTLWDYIAQTLGIEGDQNQIEEQVEMLYSEGE